MQTASFHLVFNRHQSTIPKRRVTPAELKLYIYQHGANVGGHVVAMFPKGKGAWELTGEKRVVTGRHEDKQAVEGKAKKVTVTVVDSRPIRPEEERVILVNKFGRKCVDTVFPPNTPLPTRFSEIGVNDDGTAMPVPVAETIEIEDGDTIVVAPEGPPMAPRTDGVSVASRPYEAGGGFQEGEPTHMLAAVGDDTDPHRVGRLE